MRITADQLQDAGACKDQVAIFRREWPDGATATKKSIARALDLGLDLHWFAGTWLTATALEAYEKARATAWEAYEKARAPALEAYEKATAPAWEAYEKATATALEAYEKARAPALEAYEKATARALWSAWKIGHK